VPELKKNIGIRQLMAKAAVENKDTESFITGPVERGQRLLESITETVVNTSKTFTELQ
jgi:hypothetical protein